MTGEENWYIIFCKEEKKEILDNMRGRSRKRSIRNVREKALLAAILAGAAFMMIFLFVGLKNRTSKGQNAGTGYEEYADALGEKDGNETILWDGKSYSGEFGGEEQIVSVDIEDKNSQEIERYQDFLRRMEEVKNWKELEKYGFMVIQEHVFPLEMAGEGEVFLVPALDTRCHRMVLFFAESEGEIVFRTEQLETNLQIRGRVEQKNEGVAAVSFPDVNQDGKQDVVLITLCSLPNEGGGGVYKVGDVLFQGEGSFYRDWRLSERLNRFGMGRSVKLAVSFAMEGASAEFLYEASTMDELKTRGFVVEEAWSFWRDFEKLGKLFVAPGYYKMAEYHIFMVYLANEQGRIVWSVQPMGEHENLYEILGLDSRDIDGDGLKDLTVLARYTLPKEADSSEQEAEKAEESEEEGLLNTKDKMTEEMRTEKDYAIYYQRTGGFVADTELKSRYVCGEETTLDELVELARSYWGWGTEND